jgi:coproporphyrinogen III oxidase-like Fe-S oxidoreductase
MMNGLRLTSGIEKQLFSSRTGLLTNDIQPQIARLEHDGLLKQQASNYCTTDVGARFLDSILQRFS